MSARNELHSMRLQMQSTQSFMATCMGIALRTYEDLETGKSAIRDVHLNAARYACIKIALAQGTGLGALPSTVSEDIRALTAIPS